MSQRVLEREWWGWGRKRYLLTKNDFESNDAKYPPPLCLGAVGFMICNFLDHRKFFKLSSYS